MDSLSTGSNQGDYRVLFETNPQPMWIYDLGTLAFLAVNNAAIARYGYTRDEFLAMTIKDIRPPEDVDRLKKDVASPRPDFQYSTGWRHRLKDGQVIDVEITSHTLTFDGRKAALVMAQDVTDVVQMVERLQQLSRTYAVLSNINQTIVRVRDLPTLYKRVCTIAVEDGGFPLAWIGLLNPESGSMTPVASAGAAAGYLEMLNLPSRDNLDDQSPFVKALLAGEHVICNDIATDPRMEPRRAEALKRGFLAAAAFPLIVNKVVRGSVNLYAPTLGFFDDEEVRLLDEMALDLSFAIEVSEQEAQRRQAVDELHESKERLQSSLDNMIEGCQIIDFDWVYVYLNDVAALHGRKEKGDLLGRSMLDMYPGIEETEMFTRLKTCMQERTPDHMLNEFVYPDGSIGWFQLRMEPVPEGVFVLSIDITDSKRAEIALQRYAQRMGILHRIDRGIIEAHSLPALFEVVLAHIGELVPAQHASVSVRDNGDPENWMLYTLNTTSDSAAFVKDQVVVPPEWIARLEQNEVIVVNEVETDPVTHPAHARLARLGMHAFLTVPLIAQGHLLGSLDMAAETPGLFSDNHLDVAHEIADQLAIAIQQKRLMGQLERRAEDLAQTVAERTSELRQERDHAETILNSVGEALLVVSTDGRILRVNPAFEAQTGYTAAEIDERHHYEILLVAEMPDPILQASTAAMKAGQPWRGEMPVLCKDGSIYEAAVTISPLQDGEGNVVAFVGSLRDISALKEVERMKDSLLSTATHELRTPLTSIRGFSEILLTRDLDEARRKQYLEMISQKSESLNKIINDMLDLARLESGQALKSNPEPIRCGDLVREIVIPYRETDPTHRFRIVGLDDLPPVHVDPFRITQVLRNLVDNAVKYSPEGGEIVIQGGRRNGMAAISVQDSGLGMTREQQAHLFERFYRAHTSINISGTGLGLSICKLIVEDHGGEIWVESKAGEGSIFTFTIPFAEDGN